MEKPTKNSSGKPPYKRPEEDPAKFGRYISAGFQLVAPVIAGVLIGHFIDKEMTMKTPVFTLAFATIFLGVGLYLFIKQFSK